MADNKKNFKGFTALAPLPVVIVSGGVYDEKDSKKYNMLTVAWCGIINSDVPMLSISVRKERHTYKYLTKTRELVVNIPNEKLVRAVDFIGVRSGMKVDKVKETHLTLSHGKFVKAPIINECPINIECKVKKVLELGSHDMFICEILNVAMSKEYIDGKNRICYDKMKLITYAHGEYFALGKKLGNFGFSVKKRR